MKLIQGDVILRKLDSIPEGAKEIKGKVLQESEVTGHHHHFHPEAKVTVYQTRETPDPQASITPDLGKYILVYDEPAVLYHGKGFEVDPNPSRTGDHLALTLEPGVYKVSITKEYDYDRMEEARVVD